MAIQMYGVHVLEEAAYRIVAAGRIKCAVCCAGGWILLLTVYVDVLQAVFVLISRIKMDTIILLNVYMQHFPSTW